MTTSDPEFRPRIGGRRGQIKPQRVPTLRRDLIARMQLRFRRVAGFKPRPFGPVRGRTPNAAHVREPMALARRCIVKARIVPMSAYGIKATRLHLAYIERDGVERDGSKGELYGSESVVNRDRLATVLPGEEHQFRFIVSPEDGVDLDLRQFTRDLMSQVETDIGRRLIWGAVNHHNTDNPHVHVVVRGVDVEGREVRIDPAYITRGMRWRAQEIATRELGPRNLADLHRDRDREVSHERFTSLDRDLARLASDRGEINIATLAARSKPQDRARLIGRLEVLEQLTLARRTSPRSWHLADGWQVSLRALGERGDIIKRIHSAMPQPGDTARYRVIDGRTEVDPIEGVLRRKGLHDELRGDMYAVVEDARGSAHYVRIDAATAERLTEGSIVRAAVQKERWAKDMDAVLEKVAAENGGIYDPRLHLGALKSRPMAIGGQRVEPGEVVAANVRRLERLARYRLVSPLSDGRWRVPVDLVAQLRSREISHPRLRVRVDEIAPGLSAQVNRRGPTWLDSASAGAPYGFGAEVSRSAQVRARFLRALGITGSSPEVLRTLAAVERADVGKQLAVARGMTFIAEPPVGFRGTLVPCEGTNRGTQYLAVLDERGRRLTVIPDSPALSKLRGQVVEIARGDDGRLLLRRRELSRGA